MAQRASTSDPWGTPAAVAELSSADNETTPEVSYDGLAIYFASNRAGGAGSNDIWMATRASRADAWDTPVRVGELSTGSAEGAAASTDPLVIVIDSDRAGTLDVFVAQRSSPTATWVSPMPIGEVDTGQNEGNPMMTSDGLAIYFDSNRSGNNELYVATRTSPTAAFSTPTPIGELSSAGADSDAWISPDGHTLYFTSDRDGTLRLWQTTR